jgi:hypothetical protein
VPSDHRQRHPNRRRNNRGQNSTGLSSAPLAAQLSNSPLRYARSRLSARSSALPYFSSSFLPVLRLSQFNIVLNTSA